MNVEEFELAVEETIENFPLAIWEIYDLRLLVRFTRRRGRVHRIDEMFLRHCREPMVREKLVASKPWVRKSYEQSKLF